MSSHAASTPTSKQPRVLACVLCQHRKIKCDRNMPCSNCVKANVACTPSTPAPARKRRRPNQDLQERLARCEQLLKQYSGGAIPNAGEVYATTTSPMETTPATRPSTSAHSPTSPETFDALPAGKLVQAEGGARFVDSKLWTKFHEELQAMKEIVDMDDPEDSNTVSSDSLTPNYAQLLFPSDGSGSTPGIDDIQPDPVHVFKLWQIFLDRVNPLTKLIHVPSVQPFVVEAATNPSNVPLNYQALLFSIYLMATISLSDKECTQLLSTSRDEALKRFSSGTSQTLIKYDYLRNYDMAILQALVLFLFSLQGRYDRHAAWVFNGTISRIARKMGYHRDGEYLNLTPFETEMRRRIWWQIMLQDARLALVSGINPKFTHGVHDTKQPQNLNDADLFPGSIEPVHPREGPTEMVFPIMCNRLAGFIMEESSVMAFQNAVLADTLDETVLSEDHSSREKCKDMVRALEWDMLDIEQRYCDASAGNAHIAALSLRPTLIQKFHEMLIPMREQPEWGTEIFGPTDNVFKVALANIESNLDAYERMVPYGFGWAINQDFQLEVFVILTGQLSKRTTGSLSNRVWAAVEKVYCQHTELFEVSQKQYTVPATYTLKGWRERENAAALAGKTLETPEFISKLREAMGYDSSRGNTISAAPTPPHTTSHMAQSQPWQQQQQPLDGISNDFMNSFIDPNTMDWDAWGKMEVLGQRQVDAQQAPIPDSMWRLWP